MLIKWTRAAIASFDEIAGFIAKDNPTRVTNFVLKLLAAVTKLLQAHLVNVPVVDVGVPALAPQ